MTNKCCVINNVDSRKSVAEIEFIGRRKLSQKRTLCVVLRDRRHHGDEQTCEIALQSHDNSLGR